MIQVEFIHEGKVLGTKKMYCVPRAYEGVRFNDKVHIVQTIIHNVDGKEHTAKAILLLVVEAIKKTKPSKEATED